MATKKAKGIHSFTLLMASVFLTITTGVLASIPLRVLRLTMGRKPYWLATTAIAIVLAVFQKSILLPFAFYALSILIGTFREFELRGYNLYKSGAYTLATTLFILSSGLVTWVAFKGTNALATMKAQLVTSLDGANAMAMAYGGKSLLTDELKQIVLMQSPSIVITMLLLALFFSIVMDRRVLNLLGIKGYRPRFRVSYFKIHDVVIWSFIISLFFSFYKFDIPMVQSVAVNVFNVCLLLLFFQGLAVVAKFFQIYRVAPIWRFLWFLLLFTQLAFAFSLIGLMDYWLNFRLRFAKHAAQVRGNQ